MAEIDAKLDMRELSARIEITLTHVQNVRWRLWLSTTLIRLAAWIAPLQIRMEENLLRPWLFYCAYCKREFSDSFKPHSHFLVQCPHCSRQSFAQSGSDAAWTIAIMAGECDCGYGCGFTGPYGFVPQAGCPIHD